MSPIILAFVVIMVLMFGILLVALKPSTEEKSLDKRLTQLKSTPGQISGAPDGLLLAQTEDSFAWLARITENFKISEKIQQLILHADANLTLGKFYASSVLCALSAGLLGLLFVHNTVIVGIIALQAVLYPYLYLIFRRNKRVAAFEAGLADAIDMMARALRAGHSVVAAIGIVAEEAVEPVRSEFNEVFKKQNYGLPMREALTQLADRIPSQDLRVVITGMLVQKETGGNLAEILDRIGFVVRERFRIQGEIRTHTAQGRLTGYILCGLPIVMLFLLNAINPGYSDVLFNTPGGNKLLYIGIILLILGGITIKQIINSIEV
jgi:tight adherence protein B